MNENINLCEILKGHEGETFYSPLFGENVKLYSVGPANGNGLINVQRTGKIQNGVITSFMDDGSYIKGGEIQLYPSKDQRDWNKWIEEQKPKIPKTWSDYCKIIPPPTKNDYKDYPSTINSLTSIRKDITPIEKSVLALLKIRQLIEFGYGGNLTNEEWLDDSCKYFPCPIIDNLKVKFVVGKSSYFIDKCNITFHTEEQAEEFLSYDENIQLLKDYFMI